MHMMNTMKDMSVGKLHFSQFVRGVLCCPNKVLRSLNVRNVISVVWDVISVTSLLLDCVLWRSEIISVPSVSVFRRNHMLTFPLRQFDVRIAFLPRSQLVYGYLTFSMREAYIGVTQVAQ